MTRGPRELGLCRVAASLHHLQGEDRAEMGVFGVRTACSRFAMCQAWPARKPQFGLRRFAARRRLLQGTVSRPGGEADQN